MFLCTKGTNCTISARGGYDFSCTMLLCTNCTNDTISASGIHDFSCTIFLCTNGTISASGRRDFSCTILILHERHDFRKRNTRFFARFFFARMTRMIRFPQAEYTILHDSYLARKARIIRFPQAEYTIFLRAIRAQNIVSSTCRHRIIRAIRAMKNRAVDLSTSCYSCIRYRAVDLSTSYHSCYSCHEESCCRLVDIVLFVPFVLWQRVLCHSCQ